MIKVWYDEKGDLQIDLGRIETSINIIGVLFEAKENHKREIVNDLLKDREYRKIIVESIHKNPKYLEELKNMDI